MTIEKDTDRDPYDWQTVASKGLILTGNALILACADLLAKAYQTAAQALRADVRDLDHDGEKIFIRHRPEHQRHSSRSSPSATSIPTAAAIGGPLIGVGRYIAQGLTNLNKATGQGLPALDWTYGAHGIIVEVNPTTGAYHILKIASAYDVGKAINPGVDPRTVHRRHGAGPRDGALRRLHL